MFLYCVRQSREDLSAHSNDAIIRVCSKAWQWVEKDGGNGIKVWEWEWEWECENLQVIYVLHFGPQPKVLYFIYLPYLTLLSLACHPNPTDIKVE